METRSKRDPAVQKSQMPIQATTTTTTTTTTTAPTTTTTTTTTTAATAATATTTTTTITTTTTKTTTTTTRRLRILHLSKRVVQLKAMRTYLKSQCNNAGLPTSA